MHRRKLHRRIRIGAIIILLGISGIYLVTPIVFKLSPTLQHYLIFLNSAPYIDEHLSTPENVGLKGVCNFYVETSQNIYIGVWHILPNGFWESDDIHHLGCETAFSKKFEELLPIIIYLHGNKPSRAQEHRVETYKIFQKLGYHIITFDYRGYADSSNVVPTEFGLVEDAKQLFYYIRKKAKNSPIYLWGHSLGTGVATRASSELCQLGKCPTGLVLEAAFNNIADEIRYHPLSMLFHILPFFDYFFVHPLVNSGTKFESEIHIRNVLCPILMLHSKDDYVIPLFLGKKLYNEALRLRPLRAGNVQFIKFEAGFKYHHNYIHRAPSYPEIVRNFVESSQKFKLEDDSDSLLA